MLDKQNSMHVIYALALPTMVVADTMVVTRLAAYTMITRLDKSRWFSTFAWFAHVLGYAICAAFHASIFCAALLVFWNQPTDSSTEWAIATFAATAGCLGIIASASANAACADDMRTCRIPAKILPETVRVMVERMFNAWPTLLATQFSALTLATAIRGTPLSSTAAIAGLTPPLLWISMYIGLWVTEWIAVRYARYAAMTEECAKPIASARHLNWLISPESMCIEFFVAWPLASTTVLATKVYLLVDVDRLQDNAQWMIMVDSMAYPPFIAMIFVLLWQYRQEQNGVT